jgi:lysophosphatidate acyltransferase
MAALPPRMFGPLSTFMRVLGAFTILTIGATPLLLACVVLLPWRMARIRLARLFSLSVAPPILWLLGVTYSRDVRQVIASRSPAVFVINHTSALDTFVSMAVWPPRGCSVGKKEVLAIPVFGLAYLAVGMLLIDRKNSASAVHALQKLAEEVQRNGLSIWMAPEGTRSRDGCLAPFKKGFVHMAIATGLPVVPVVLHGAFERLPVDTWRLSPGHIDIELLDSFESTHWKPETAGEHAEEVHRAFQAALLAKRSN